MNEPKHSTIDRTLAPLGFRKRGVTWTRERESFVGLVNLQRSSDNEAITVNLGVLDRDVFRTCWGEEVPLHPGDAHCTVRTRLEDSDDGKTWWAVDDPLAAGAIQGSLIATGLPFIERMHSRSAML